MTNPHQQPAPDILGLVEAVRAIAERTAWRTEAERDAVYRACDVAELYAPHYARLLVLAEELLATDDAAAEEPTGPTGDGDADLKTAAKTARK